MYNWKRFWCINTGNIRLDYGGFLEDPESEYGHNPDVVPFNSISHIPCLVLLGEPGIGKTTAINQAFSELKTELETSEDDCLFFNLGDFDSNQDLLNGIFQSDKFIKWLNGNYKLHLFLDSLDEGLLSVTTIIRFLCKHIDNVPVERLYFRITCRTSVWLESISFEQKLKEKWKEDNTKIYELAPLRRVDVIEVAKAKSINHELFIQEILDKEVTPLAINPITLKFLTDTYLKNGNFPDSKKELYKQGLLQLCTENNQDRLAEGYRGSLNAYQRLIIAGRIASILLLARKTAIWTSTEMVDMPDSDIVILDLCVGKEIINQQEFLVKDDHIRKEVLSITGLFSSRGSNRMGFAHQTYAEFLAAWYLTERNLPLVQVMSLIVSQGDPESKLIPQLHETAAWLASMRMDILEEIIKTDPDVLLRSDISTNVDIQEKIVSSLLNHYDQGKLTGRNLRSVFQYKKLKHPRLPEQLRPYIQDSSKSLEVRDEAIDIAKDCDVHELGEDLATLALDSSQSIHLRVNAANALCSIGNSETKLKLKPLAIGNIEKDEDEDDQLKGYSLEAVWPEHLTAEELFNAITPPKRRNFFGGYQSFLNNKLASKLQPSDLLLALQWLEKQGLRVSGNSFEKIGNEILLKAWENIDIPGIAKAFSKIALIQWQEYQKLITQRDYSQYDFQSELLQDDNKRRILLENLVLEISEQNKDSDIIHPLTDFTEQVILSQDLFWMLDKLQNTESQEVQKIWVQLIEWSFNRQDAKQIDAVITATQANHILRDHFTAYFEAIELNSSQADKMKANYQRMESLQKGTKEELPLKQTPQERVILCLENLENTDRLDWWFQLNLEMTLSPQSKYYGNELEHDLTELPGWKEADQTIKQRIINGAKKYILEQKEIDYTWIGTDNFNILALAGCKAIYLLLKESPKSLDILTDEIWQKWTSVIISYPNVGRVDNYYYDLVGIAYKKAPNKTIETLLILINKENQKYNDVFTIDKFSKCWDEYFKSLILTEINNNQSLKPNTIQKLLRELLKYGYQPAKEFAKSLISNPLPIEQEEYQKIVLATVILIENADSDDWLLIWSIIQQDTKFGHKVFEAIANRHSFGINLNITEVQLADLYIWMIQQYPPNEDPVYEGVHQITNREQVSDFRNSILTQLKERGTSRSCLEIQRISKELPELTWMNRVLVEAQIIRRRKEWNPPTPSEIFELISNTEKRFVQDGNELLNVLIETLKKLDIELQDQNPSVIDLWNEIPWQKVQNLAKSLFEKLQEENVIVQPATIKDLIQVHHKKNKGTTYIPKDENSLSDYVARYLKNNLKNRGIILNREVEIRPLQGGGKGERTDIQVDAVIKKANGETLDQITVIIEVKGSWNKDLDTSMEKQLVNRYLKDNTCQHGIYLVGCFYCEQWDKSDYRKGKSLKISIDKAREKFEQQAEQLSQSGVKVKSFVLNTALR
ncbi:MAG: hypothetical protein HEQ20_14545 [Aphanizomenon flos-aquae KM1D3_PB]|uniref:NACHT domain-containing protein n=1 Tax=Aphanizomenon flos-aquae TaxID=1176 RepID=UPI000689C227|nr:hypothetical protein [Aphanizomenon flos-aquae]QSV71741.1 MAG: hypothetical protein HEQ20_14545 [Aphanizomenon flos-aquae KM1D3_PB]